MDTMTVLVILGLGAAGGFPVGRWWAENARAHHDMNQTWNKRTAYREKKND